MSSTIDRIAAEIGVPDIVTRLAEKLSPTDLQSLLLAVYAQRSTARTPADLLADYARSRFFGASPLPHAGFLHWAALAERAAQNFEFLTLSPMTPLATAAAVATVGQDWSVPTARTGEVVSDPTNVLALEAALRRRRHPAQPVHLGTIHRVLRPQAYANKAALAHFSLLGLVSSARDTGSFATEAAMLRSHIGALIDLFATGLGTSDGLSLSYTLRSTSHEDARLTAFAGIATEKNIPLWEEADRPAVESYYAGCCFHIWLGDGEARRQLADGGTVDWGAKLLANGKERMLISGAGLDGLVACTQDQKERGQEKLSKFSPLARR